MEFKGTKGKWKPKLHNGKYWKVINKNNETICNINSKSTLKIKEEQANAQIISHAPEMLEMLQSCVNLLERMEPEENSKCDFKIQEIKQLIKKSTTI